MFYAHPSLPVHQVPPKPKKNRKGSKSAPAPVAAPTSSIPLTSPPPTPAGSFQHDAKTITNLLEPAIDGPPSPESIRVFQKQMKRTSTLDKHQSHQTNSSGSASLRSQNSTDRPSWENGLEAQSLSRKSSGRSTSSSLQHRDRPDSVQIFGKTIFNRRGRLRRESSAFNSSSGSSLQSAEAIQQPGSSVSKDGLIPSVFGRRRGPKMDAAAEEAETRNKFQISGPYNFQHLTNNELDQPAGEAEFAGFSSEALPLEELGANTVPRAPALRSPPLPQHPFLQRTRSQDQLRAPPPRPPRSPLESTFNAPPVPPPRISSRVSIRYDGFNPLDSTSLERPQTSGGGFRQAQPLAIAEEDMDSQPAERILPNVANITAAAEKRYSQVFVCDSGESNWPLSCPLTGPSGSSFEAALPDVPEEDEQAHLGHRSRVSTASNTSSLRGSQSVPLLRQLAQTQPTTAAARPPSGASDTLGRFDPLAAALRAASEHTQNSEMLPRESWEDDIDYCYEHEAEADCDFAWDRPSLEGGREDIFPTPIVLKRPKIHARHPSSAKVKMAQSDVPALSPGSQASPAASQEAITPGTAVSSNFSLPRADRHQSQRFLHVRPVSQASSFKESHGFTLSPSLLIPSSDYHREMLAHEADEVLAKEFPAYEEPTMTMETSTLLVQSRASASTIASISDHSNSERHISTASASTAMTQLTESTSSLTIDDYAKAEPVPYTESKKAMAILGRTRGASLSHTRSAPEERPESPRSREGLFSRRAKDEGGSKLTKSKGSGPFRRQRAQTTSVSSPRPTVQYVSYPAVNMTASRI